MQAIKQLKQEGYLVLKKAVNEAEIANLRASVLEHSDFMANTRPTASARHIAGFHRIPALEPLHALITSNRPLNKALHAYFDTGNYIAIGLSDIVINRSQGWHSDLLRGEYSKFLDPNFCWGAGVYGCLKALLYLQKGNSLTVLPGSHLTPFSLENDGVYEKLNHDSARAIDVNEGDLVIMDIRLVHRGSTEAAMRTLGPENPKILISTVFGRRDEPFTRAMELGNLHRLLDWEDRHLQ